MQHTKIKICGLTNLEELKWVSEEAADFAGIVMFFPKSKRNMEPERVEILFKQYKEWLTATNRRKAPKFVAVTVSPTREQIEKIITLGFDYIQIHGTIRKDAFHAIYLPMIRAVQIKEDKQICAKVDMGKEASSPDCGQEEIATEEELMSLATYRLYDAAEPGSGKTFDWDALSKIGDNNLILAGGLTVDNVEKAIEYVHPAVVDVSSGVEIAKDMVGKDHAKIKEFVRKVRTNE